MLSKKIKIICIGLLSLFLTKETMAGGSPLASGTIALVCNKNYALFIGMPCLMFFVITIQIDYIICLKSILYLLLIGGAILSSRIAYFV